VKILDNKKMFDEMMSNPKYKELLITSPFFNKILQTIRYNDIGEKELIEIISILCERIEELEKDLIRLIKGGNNSAKI
jgi:hypothetical protein